MMQHWLMMDSVSVLCGRECLYWEFGGYYHCDFNALRRGFRDKQKDAGVNSFCIYITSKNLP